jgi:hypothetical protein
MLAMWLVIGYLAFWLVGGCDWLYGHLIGVTGGVKLATKNLNCRKKFVTSIYFAIWLMCLVCRGSSGCDPYGKEGGRLGIPAIFHFLVSRDKINYITSSWPKVYWMIYRGPGFLDLAPIPTSPNNKLDLRHTGRLRKRDNLLTGEGGRVGRGGPN